MNVDVDLLESLRTQMRLRGWTQKDVGAILGISNSSVSKYLRGEALPPVTLAGRLAELLGLPVVDVEQILLALHSKAQPPTEVQEMISLLRDLQAQTQRIQSRIGQLESRVEALQNQLS